MYHVMTRQHGFTGRATSYAAPVTNDATAPVEAGDPEITVEDDTVITPEHALLRETRVYETTLQIGALLDVGRAPAPDQMTATDYVEGARRILTGDAGIAALHAFGVSALRPTEVRDVYFKNDRGAYESVPSFDIALTYVHVSTSEIPAASTVDRAVAARV